MELTKHRLKAGSIVSALNPSEIVRGMYWLLDDVPFDFKGDEQEYCAMLADNIAQSEAAVTALVAAAKQALIHIRGDEMAAVPILEDAIAKAEGKS